MWSSLKNLDACSLVEIKETPTASPFSLDAWVVCWSKAQQPGSPINETTGRQRKSADGR